MWTSVLITLASMATSAQGGPGAQEQFLEAAAPTILVKYREPTNPAYRPVCADLKGRRLLQKLAKVLESRQMPRTLTLAFVGCDGVSNVWYDSDNTTVTFRCEYVAEIPRAAARYKRRKVSLRDATGGPVVFSLLHEVGHAVFDLLEVTVPGRKADAADYFASVFLLSMGKGVAFRALEGAAWNHAQEVRARKPDESDFADTHGLEALRYYNILCLAYGSDPETLREAAKVGHLHPERAAGCFDEFHQALFAVHKFIVPTIDAEAPEEQAP